MVADWQQCGSTMAPAMAPRRHATSMNNQGCLVRVPRTVFDDTDLSDIEQRRLRAVACLGTGVLHKMHSPLSTTYYAKFLSIPNGSLL